MGENMGETWAAEPKVKTVALLTLIWGGMTTVSVRAPRADDLGRLLAFVRETFPRPLGTTLRQEGRNRASVDRAL
jgi:hypothetical protein